MCQIVRDMCFLLACSACNKNSYQRLSSLVAVAIMLDNIGDGWLGFNGILNTQAAAISCLKELRPNTHCHRDASTVPRIL